MDSVQKSVIQEHFAELSQKLNLDAVLNWLRINEILAKDHFEKIQHQSTDCTRRAKFLELIQWQNNGWIALLNALDAANQSQLVKLLETSATFKYMGQPASKRARITATSNTFLESLQRQLKESILEDCQIIHQAWKAFMSTTKLDLAFQTLEVIETNGCPTKEIPIGSYDYLADPGFRVFLIEGNPGIGKSTYVNQIAQDWAKGDNSFLNKTFDIVINTAWQNLQENWKESIELEFWRPKFAGILDTLLQSSRTLIILDGYDENPLRETMLDIIAKDDPMHYRRFARIVITTRGSHVHQFKDSNLMWLRVRGFDDRSAAQFISQQLQKRITTDGEQKLRTEQILATHASLIEICKNPLYATMIAATELTAKLCGMQSQMRFMKIFDQFAEFQKETYFKKGLGINRGSEYVINGSEYDSLIIDKLGNYALQFLDTETKESLQCTVQVASTVNKSKTLEKKWFQLGLFQDDTAERSTKSRFRSARNFLHFTFAEYYAAKYVAKNGKSTKTAIKLSKASMFRYFLLTLRNDYLIANAKNDELQLISVPNVGIFSKGIIELLFKLPVEKIEFNEWKIDNSNVELISETNAKRLCLNNCNFDLLPNGKTKLNHTVMEICVSDCKWHTVNCFELFFKTIIEGCPLLILLTLLRTQDKADNVFVNIDLVKTFGSNRRPTKVRIEDVPAKVLEFDMIVTIQQFNFNVQSIFIHKCKKLDNYIAQLLMQCKHSEKIEYLGDRNQLSLSPLMPAIATYDALKQLHLNYCSIEHTNVAAVSMIATLSVLTVNRVVLKKKGNIDNMPMLTLTLHEVQIICSSGFLLFATKNIKLIAERATLQTSWKTQLNDAFRQNLLESSFYFNEKLTFVADPCNDLEAMGDTVITLLRLSKCVEFVVGDDKSDSTYFIKFDSSNSTSASELYINGKNDWPFIANHFILSIVDRLCNSTFSVVDCAPLSLYASLEPAVTSESAKSMFSQIFDDLKRYLRQNIIEDNKIILQASSDNLLVSKVPFGLQKLQMRSTAEAQRQDIDANNYEYLTDSKLHIILIEGDPGIGKTTYINQIALEWALGNKLLNEAFDLLIKVSWLDLEEEYFEVVGLKRSIVLQLGNQNFVTCFNDLLLLKKTLIILDGYTNNEYESTTFLAEITEQLRKYGSRITSKLMITSAQPFDLQDLELKITRLRILGFEGTSVAKFISAQQNNAETWQQILEKHLNLINIYRNPLFAAMIEATELTSIIFEVEPQMSIKEIFDKYAVCHKTSYLKKYPNVSAEEYEEAIELFGKLSLQFFNSDARTQLNNCLSINCETKIEFGNAMKQQWLQMGFIQSHTRKLGTETIHQINLLPQTLREYFAALYVIKHGKLSKDNFIDLNSVRELFRRVLLAERRDILTACTKRQDKVTLFPHLPLPTQTMIEYLNECNARIIQLDKWIIDENSGKLISSVGAQQIKLNKCEIRLSNLPYVADITCSNSAAEQLFVHKCNLPLERFAAFWRFVQHQFLHLSLLELFDTSEPEVSIELIKIFDTERGPNTAIIRSSVRYALELVKLQQLLPYKEQAIEVFAEKRIDNDLIRSLALTCTNIENFQWNGDYFNAQHPAFAAFSNIQERLKKLKLTACKIDIAGIAAICRLASLTSLELWHVNVEELQNGSQIVESNLELNLDEIIVSGCESFLLLAVKNISVKSRTAKFQSWGLSPFLDIFSATLCGKPWHFYDKLTIQLKDTWSNPDCSCAVECIVSMLHLSKRIAINLTDPQSIRYSTQFIISVLCGGHTCWLVVNASHPDWLKKLDEALIEKCYSLNFFKIEKVSII